MYLSYCTCFWPVNCFLLHVPFRKIIVSRICSVVQFPRLAVSPLECSWEPPPLSLWPTRNSARNPSGELYSYTPRTCLHDHVFSVWVIYVKADVFPSLVCHAVLLFQGLWIGPSIYLFGKTLDLRCFKCSSGTKTPSNLSKDLWKPWVAMDLSSRHLLSRRPRLLWASRLL